MTGASPRRPSSVGPGTLSVGAPRRLGAPRVVDTSHVVNGEAPRGRTSRRGGPVPLGSVGLRPPDELRFVGGASVGQTLALREEVCTVSLELGPAPGTVRGGPVLRLGAGPSDSAAAGGPLIGAGPPVGGRPVSGPRTARGPGSRSRESDASLRETVPPVGAWRPRPTGGRCSLQNQTAVVRRAPLQGDTPGFGSWCMGPVPMHRRTWRSPIAAPAPAWDRSCHWAAADRSIEGAGARRRCHIARSRPLGPRPRHEGRPRRRRPHHHLGGQTRSPGPLVRKQQPHVVPVRPSRPRRSRAMAVRLPSPEGPVRQHGSGDRRPRVA